MQAQPNPTSSRKRPAPGTVPASMQNSTMQQSGNQSQPYNGLPDLSDFPDAPDTDFLNWGGDRISDLGNIQDNGPLDGVDGAGQMQGSNQLVRRNRNNQLAHRGSFGNSGQAAWPDFSTVPAASWQNFEDDDDELDRKAAEAKREAQSKRPPKSIPPFIQKLSSFLDNPTYSHLIRWTDDGKSFVVLDEDEFAKQLIPELFKHNNYASFVRQLNMYGFHKKVGLSDNSMRASEKKAKSPSEYSNPYFRRGRPELLWLISKPKNEPSKSKTKKGKSAAENDQDGDNGDRGAGTDGYTDSGGTGRGQDLVKVPREQLVQFQRELQDMKRQQQQINQLISHFQHENARFIQQASAQHERHENSINAILTFLATFYSRSVEGNGNFHSMFPNSIPDNQTSGNVMDMDDPYSAAAQSNNQLVRTQRRPLALLPPPIQEEKSRISPISATQSPRSPLPPSRQNQRSSNARRSSEFENRQPISPRVKEQSSTPDALNQMPEGNGRRSVAPSNSDMMAAINDANATTSDQSQTFDFPTALKHFENANGNAPLTPEQRDNMLSMLANTTNNGTPSNMLSTFRNSDNSLDYTNQYNSNQNQLERLQRMQGDLDQRMQDIAGRIQPLSPGGVIPGYNSVGNSPSASQGFGNDSASEFDFGKFLNSDYFPDTSNGDADDFKDYGFTSNVANAGNNETDGNFQSNGEDDASLFGESPQLDTGDDGLLQPGGGGGRVVGSVATSSGAPSPSVEDEADDAPRKKQKTGSGNARRSQVSVG